MVRTVVKRLTALPGAADAGLSPAFVDPRAGHATFAELRARRS
jgi:hypothetical protein